MRLFKMTVLSLIIILLASAPLFSQQMSVAGFGGMGMPMSPEFLKDNWKSGLGFGVKFQYHITEKTAFSIGFQSQTLQSTFTDKLESAFLKIAPEYIDEDILSGLQLLNKSLDDLDIALDGLHAKSNIIKFNAIQYVTPQSSPISAYATAGPGFYMMKFTELEVDADNVPVLGSYSDDFKVIEKGKNKLGINAGIGVEILFAGNLFFFLEGSYHHVFTDAADLMELESEEADEILDSFGIDDGKIAFVSIVGGLRIPLN